MAHWNYRVGRKAEYWYGEEFTYAIIEVYYEDNGKVKGYTGFVGPQGDSLEALKDDLERMKEAFDKPVFEMDDSEDLTNL